MKTGYYWVRFNRSQQIVHVFTLMQRGRKIIMVESIGTPETREFPSIYTDYRGPLEEPE